MAEKVILISCLPSKFKQKQAPKLFSCNQNIPFKKSNIPFEKSRKKSGGWVGVYDISMKNYRKPINRYF